MTPRINPNHARQIVYDYANNNLSLQDAVYQLTRLGLGSRQAEELLTNPARYRPIVEKQRAKIMPPPKRKKRYWDFIVAGLANRMSAAATK